MVISLVGTGFASYFHGRRGFAVIYPMHEVILVHQVGLINDEVKPEDIYCSYLFYDVYSPGAIKTHLHLISMKKV